MLEVPTAQDEDPVQALGPDRADPTLGEGVGLRYSCKIRGPPLARNAGAPTHRAGWVDPLGLGTGSSGLWGCHLNRQGEYPIRRVLAEVDGAECRALDEAGRVGLGLGRG